MPPLSFPADAAERARIPDDWTVWAFTDIHGVRSGLEAALRKARVLDAGGRWIARPRTAVVGLGDFIDRGTDSAGVIELLRRVGAEAQAAGSRVVLVRGNHEQLLIDVLHGERHSLGPFLARGGDEFLRSVGWDGDDPAVDAVVAFLASRDDAVLPFLVDTLPYAVWRDVLMTHAGPPAGIHALPDLTDHDAQMWHSGPFLASAGIATDPAFGIYRDAGIGRVVIGHVPQVAGPKTLHDGTAMLIDTNASAPPRKPGKIDWHSYATLVRLTPGPRFDRAKVIMIDTSDAPDRAPRRGGR